MKKIFTLIAASLLTMAVFAADHRPSVTIQSSKNYVVVIDGKNYLSRNIGSMTIDNLRNGLHTITVYSKANRRGLFFMKSKKVVATKSFMLRGDDIRISIDMFGRIDVKELRNGRDWDKKDRDSGFGKDYRQDKDDHNKRF